MKKVLSFTILLFVCFLVIGCGTQDKEYSSNGFNITLLSNFYEKDQASLTAYFESSEAMVSALKEDFTSLEIVGINEDSTIDDYAEAVFANNGTEYDLLSVGNKYKYFTYEKEVSGKNYFYYTALYKSTDSFWLVTFASELKNKDKYKSIFENWANSVKFE